MRPKKVLLCVSPNEVRLSCQVFFFETRGFAVLRANCVDDALTLLADREPDTVHAVVSEFDWNLDGNYLAREAKKLHPGLPILLLSHTIAIWMEHMDANVFLPKGCTDPALVLERTRILVARKRGPKKAIKEEVAA